MKSYKRWALRFFWTSISLVVLVAAVNFVVDPLQQYRQASFYEPVYRKARYLNPGLAKTHDYETVVIGTSMAQNFRPSYIDRAMGTRSIKLPINGGSAYEESLTLAAAIGSGQVRKVIFGLDVFSFVGAPERLKYGPGSLPLYLYDGNPLNDVSYLLSFDTLAYYKYLIRTNLLGRERDATDYDSYGFWGNKHLFGPQQVWESWRAGEFNADFREDDFRFRRLKESFDFNLLRQIQDNPDVEFMIFYPPYTPLVWVDLMKKGVFEDALLFKEYVYDSVKTLKNARVFDFQDEQEVTFDLANYKDISHYAPEINDWMIDSMAAGRYLVGDENVEARLRALRQQMEEFIERFKP